MSQIISLHIGGCGINVGLSFWQQAIKEAQSNSQQGQINGSQVHYARIFNQYSKKTTTKVPRALFIDTDERSRHKIAKYDSENNWSTCIGGTSSCNSLFAEGYYRSGADLTDRIVDDVRKQVERCDFFTGFILTSSSTGGAGSGLAAKALIKIRETYPSKMFEDFKVFPGPQGVQNSYRNLNPLQVYNIVLNTQYLIQNTDLYHILQNSAVDRILKKRDQLHTSYNEVNTHFAMCMNEHICPYIRPGSLNTNQRKRAINLLLFPRIKFICGALNESGKGMSYLESAFENRNKLMVHPAPADKRIYGINLNVRDTFASQNEVYRKFQQWKQRSSNLMAQWLPCSTHISLGPPKSPSTPSAWILYNGSHNVCWIRSVSQLFAAQFRRKAFVHQYRSLGMDQMEFIEAESNMNDITSEYEPCTCCAMDEDMNDYQEDY